MENKTSIYIYENQNLQSIFDWRSHDNVKLKLKNGHIKIYNNMLLCPSETKRFQDMIERSNGSSQGNSITDDMIISNGGKTKCTTANEIRNTSSFVLSHDSCSIRWSDANLKNNHRFNAFIIQYLATSHSYLDMHIDEEIFLERDTCSSFGWQQIFVRDLHYRPDGLLEYNLTSLHQFTTYAFRVQMYQHGGDLGGSSSISLNSSEYEGAISQVKTFRTSLNVPSRVKNFETLSRTSDKISLQWSVVDNEQPAIKSFILDILSIPFNVTQIDKRNYCIDPIKRNGLHSFVTTYQVSHLQEPHKKNQCCEFCCKLQDEITRREKENLDFQMKLEKFSEQVPRRNLEPRVEIKNHKNFLERVELTVEQRNFTFENLRPFTLYTFYIQACASDTKCSDFEVHSQMTQMNIFESFDQVELLPTSYEFESKSFHVRFKEPSSVNGAIICYYTELIKIVKNASFPVSYDCVTRRQHEMSDFK